MNKLSRAVAACVLIMLGVVAWLHDFITVSGAKTVHEVQCASGAWQGRLCSGHLVAGPRHRFKVLNAHAEVLHWVAGSPQASDKLTGCEIENARNWACTGATSAIPVHAMKYGLPQSTAKELHTVSKWKWWLLAEGAQIFQEADT